MAIEKKRMKQYRGPWEKFDKSQVLPYEFAAIASGGPNSADGKELHFAFGAGNVKQIMTREDAEVLIENKTDDIVHELTDHVEAAVSNAESAAGHANTAAAYANEQGERAELAANHAATVADDLISRREAGEFIGPPGPQGPQGEDGEDGADAVITELRTGLFAMSVRDGHLYVTHDSSDPAPMLKIVDGRLKYVIGGS